MQNRQTTEVQDLIDKFTESWPDVKVSCLLWYIALMMMKGPCRLMHTGQSQKETLEAADNLTRGRSVQATPAFMLCL